MATIRLTVAFQGIVLEKVAARAADAGPVIATWPNLFRNGPEGIANQISTRTYHSPAGEARSWVEPSYQSGALPAEAVLREAVLWDAARGIGPAAITRHDTRSATIGVDDGIIHTRSAQLGNAVVAPIEAAYFATVTGSWDERQASANIVPYKVAVLARGGRKQGDGKGFKPQNVDDYTSRWAMFWFLGLTFNFWPTAEELLAGIPTPPKNLGISKQVIDLARDEAGHWIATGQLRRAG